MRGKQCFELVIHQAQHSFGPLVHVKVMVTDLQNLATEIHDSHSRMAAADVCPKENPAVRIDDQAFGGPSTGIAHEGITGYQTHIDEPIQVRGHRPTSKSRLLNQLSATHCLP